MNCVVFLMRHCIVAFCRNRGAIPGVRYFRVTGNRREAWLKALGRQPTDEVSVLSSVCSIHFRDEDFEEVNEIQKLKVNAVPSLHLKPEKKQLTFQHVCTEKTCCRFKNLTMKSTSKRYCSVPLCHSYSSKDISLYYFPHSDPKTCSEWKRVLQIAKPISKYMNVCSKHFSENDFIRDGNKVRKYKRLKKGAIPSRNIPSSSITKKKEKCKTTRTLGERTKYAIVCSCRIENVDRTNVPPTYFWKPEQTKRWKPPEELPSNHDSNKNLRKLDASTSSASKIEEIADYIFTEHSYSLWKGSESESDKNMQFEFVNCMSEAEFLEDTKDTFMSIQDVVVKEELVENEFENTENEENMNASNIFLNQVKQEIQEDVELPELKIEEEDIFIKDEITEVDESETCFIKTEDEESDNRGDNVVFI